ncbi:MEKHLA domain-containing protein [Kiloniella sp. EL199]|uniref:MEKHLA domain-containing protein n=1 Tax=Kiloniella sp. EL199 TaxID=2107581 RepID=UPI001C1F79BF
MYGKWLGKILQGHLHAGKTAEPEFRNDRAAMLEPTKEKGYFDNYTGIRIPSSGRRLLIEKVIIWTVLPVVESDDLDAQKKGQAAMFNSWTYLDE